MKKVSMLICLFLLTIVFIPNCYAINYYTSVSVKTAFSEEINLEEINTIEIAYADQTNYTKYITLTKDNNFGTQLENIPVGPINVEYGIVNDDTIGYYNVSADVYDNYDNTMEIIVNVSLQNNTKNENVVNDLQDKIVPSTNASNVNKNDHSSHKEETDISEDKTTTSTTNKVIIDEEEELKKQEAKKAANRKKSNIIGIVMFSIIGIVFGVFIIYAAIKISKANK